MNSKQEEKPKDRPSIQWKPAQPRRDRRTGRATSDTLTRDRLIVEIRGRISDGKFRPGETLGVDCTVGFPKYERYAEIMRRQINIFLREQNLLDRYKCHADVDPTNGHHIVTVECLLPPEPEKSHRSK